MAEVAADLLLAYPAVDAARCAKIAMLAGQRTMRAAVDSAAAADALADAARAAGSTVGILVDLDVGMHRTGVQSPQAALELAQHVSRTGGLRLDGLFFYPGHIGGPPDTQANALRAVSAMLDETLALWSRAGLAASIVSGGSTPTMLQSHAIAAQTELRPGTYVYNDMNTVRGGYCSLDDCAAYLVCTVVSTSVPGKVVVDAGSKTLTSDRNGPKPDSGHGHVIEYPGAVITRLSEEHGEIGITGCQRAPRIGERVRIIPNHICPCVNLQDAAWLRNDDGSLETLRIDARGMLS
jgi:D-serine deaminase-like pyridoxal phosphate-dependent protein